MRFAIGERPQVNGMFAGGLRQIPIVFVFFFLVLFFFFSQSIMDTLTGRESGSGQASPEMDPSQSREQQVQNPQESRLSAQWIVDRRAVA